jgi:hypothetical protein
VRENKGRSVPFVTESALNLLYLAYKTCPSGLSAVSAKAVYRPSLARRDLNEKKLPATVVAKILRPMQLAARGGTDGEVRLERSEPRFGLIGRNGACDVVNLWGNSVRDWEYLVPRRNLVCLGCNGGNHDIRVLLRCFFVSGMSQSKHSRLSVPITLHKANSLRAPNRCPDYFEAKPRRIIEVARKDSVAVVDDKTVGVVGRMAAHSCCSVPAAVGRAVTLAWIIRREKCSISTNTYRIRKVTAASPQKLRQQWPVRDS